MAWLTGLSGSGKSTIAMLAASALRDRGVSVSILDGDVVRRSVHAHLGFGAADIRENNRLVAELCAEEIEHHEVVLVPLISPFRDSRVAARQVLGEKFSEVFIKASLEEVSRRDPKGLYRRARGGHLKGLIGVDPLVPYEPPVSPALVLDTEEQDGQSCAAELVHFILGRLRADRQAAQ